MSPAAPRWYTFPTARSMFVAKVVVRRATPGTKGFDPNRVDIEWLRRS